MESVQFVQTMAVVLIINTFLRHIFASSTKYRSHICPEEVNRGTSRNVLIKTAGL